MSMTELKQRLFNILPAFSIREEELLSKHTSFRIGGPAELMVFPNSPEQLRQIFLAAGTCGIKPRILGSGSNVLAPDEGVRGLVICTRECLMGLELVNGTQVIAMSGMTLAQTAMFAARNGLSGLEFAHGIPGSVGGGIYMNAGAYGGELKDCAAWTEFMDLFGNILRYEGAEQGLAYRSSSFQGKEGIILRSCFSLTASDEATVRSRIKELNDRRRASQPLELPSAGSTFKRPKTGYAAALIQEAGLKGLRVGGAAVSEKHAGFVVNLGGARAKDVLELIAMVQEKVLAHSGVALEPEVRLWGTDHEA
ncbi:MAG: UDP-N-acetylmuramate dehydrogenase [Oscillospiraceae bacterium]|nr:UDP-N-acetylmuramate dehydrogenase [Oscillospiraceae bacterium]